MKLLMIGAFPPRKAAEADHAFYLSQHLADCGLDVHVLTTRGSVSPKHPQVRLYPIIKDWSWSDLPCLKRMVRSCSPDAIVLVYTRGVYDGHPMITFSPTLCKTLLPRVPFVTLFEDAPSIPAAADTRSSLVRRAFRSGVALCRTLMRRPPIVVSAVRMGMALWAGRENLDDKYGTLLRDSDRVIVVSESARAGLAARFSAVVDKSVLIPPPPLLRVSPENNGVTRQSFRERLGINRDDWVIVYFGYIYPGKGVETLFKAFKILSAQRADVRLMMVGGDIELKNHSSYIREIHRMPKAMGIHDKVTWTGGYAWDSDEGSGYLRAADICVLPVDSGISLHHSSFAAAAVHGLPVLTTCGETLERPFVHKKNVFLCSPQDPEAMEQGMETLIESSEIRQNLRAGVLKLAEEWYSWETATRRTIATLDEIVHENDRGKASL
jgi:glycosyltransferase involved in cell wall biosynthesis